MGAAHTICPYSEDTRGNVGVALFVGDEPVHA
jgi:organic hydroperoxide reductase OsmC/OhrA